MTASNIANSQIYDGATSGNEIASAWHVEFEARHLLEAAALRVTLRERSNAVASPTCIKANSLDVCDDVVEIDIRRSQINQWIIDTGDLLYDVVKRSLEAQQHIHLIKAKCTASQQVGRRRGNAIETQDDTFYKLPLHVDTVIINDTALKFFGAKQRLKALRRLDCLLCQKDNLAVGTSLLPLLAFSCCTLVRPKLLADTHEAAGNGSNSPKRLYPRSDCLVLTGIETTEKHHEKCTDCGGDSNSKCHCCPTPSFNGHRPPRSSRSALHRSTGQISQYLDSASSQHYRSQEASS